MQPQRRSPTSILILWAESIVCSLLPVPNASHWRTKPPVAPVASPHSFYVNTLLYAARRQTRASVVRSPWVSYARTNLLDFQISIVRSAPMSKEPFAVAVPEDTLVDLRERLARTRWPEEIGNDNWQYGTNLAYLKELVTYWRTASDL